MSYMYECEKGQGSLLSAIIILHAKLKAPDLGISFTIPLCYAAGCQNGIFCGRKLEEEEEGGREA